MNGAYSACGVNGALRENPADSIGAHRFADLWKSAAFFCVGGADDSANNHRALTRRWAAQDGVGGLMKLSRF